MCQLESPVLAFSWVHLLILLIFFYFYKVHLFPVFVHHLHIHAPYARVDMIICVCAHVYLSIMHLCACLYS